MSTETLLQKIKKLLALAEGNANDHEREVAMQFAMDLLAKHNLTLSEIQDIDLDNQTNEYPINLRMEKWITCLLQGVCTLYYTRFYEEVTRDWYGRRKSFPVLVGTRENVDVTIEVMSWLMNSIRLESNYLYRDPYERRSFRLGAAEKVWDRAEEIIEKEKNNTAHSGTGNLMVLRNKLESANERYMDKLNLTQVKRRASYIDPDAYSKGTDFGNEIGLDRRSTKGRIALK